MSTDYIFRLRRDYQFSEQMARLVLALLKHEYMNASQIEEELGLTRDASAAQVAIHRLRQQLMKLEPEHRFLVQSMRGKGYYLTPEVKAALAARLIDRAA